jgi:hypothetical protein
VESQEGQTREHDCKFLMFMMTFGENEKNIVTIILHDILLIVTICESKKPNTVKMS